MRKLKKIKACADACGGEETSKLTEHKIKQKDEELDKWCNDNNLCRDYSRELVSEQIRKNELNINHNNDIINSAAEAPYNNEQLIYNPDAKYEIVLSDKS